MTLHRFVLAELNTHRVFSRNSASSRAIPVAKQLARIEADPAIPVEFGANQRGMQAGAPLSGTEHEAALATWLAARDAAVAAARSLGEQGVHKQVTNRLLEPFMWHTVIVTSTDWDGFWDQRCSPLAQPEIRVAAEAMRAAFDASEPTALAHGDWHTPYVRADDGDLDVETRKRIAAARCARVSYLTPRRAPRPRGRRPALPAPRQRRPAALVATGARRPPDARRRAGARQPPRLAPAASRRRRLRPAGPVRADLTLRSER